MALGTNIISYWKLDGDSTDSVSSFNGTDTGVTYNNTYGIINNGVRFVNTPGSPSSASQFINVSNPTPPGTGDFTMSYWFNPQGTISSSVQQNPVHWEQSGLSGRPYFTFDVVSTGITFAMDDNTNSANVTKTMTISANTWYFVIATRDSSTKVVSLYVNAGTPVTTTPAANANMNMTNTFTFGRRFNSSYSTDQYPFNGYLDEVGYWSRALSSAEVTQLYNGGAGLQYPFPNAAAAQSRALMGVGN